MAIQRVDEVLDKALSTDSAVVPRYDVVLPNGTKVAENAELVLKNPVLVEGMPINKQAMDECLAASGVTAGTATAFTLAQPGFVLADGALIRFRLHVDSGATPTINVNGTGAKKLMQDKYKPMKTTFAGTWVTAVYSSTFGFFVLQGSGDQSTTRYGTGKLQITSEELAFYAYNPYYERRFLRSKEGIKMGFKLFKASGTFNPATEGLSINDTIHVIVVGGGASGECVTGKPGSYTYTSNAGSASSFGSYATALGGVNARNGNQGNGKGAAPGSAGRGSGAGGWIPDLSFSLGYDALTTDITGAPTTAAGIDPDAFNSANPSSSNGTITMTASKRSSFGGGSSAWCYTPSDGNSIAIGVSGSAYGVGAEAGKGYGGDWNEGSTALGGGGGAGYGAGGGGGGNGGSKYDTKSDWAQTIGYGGNSGQVVEKDITLTSLSAIAVTVGAGGARAEASSGATYYAGAGAPGCVIVFW